MRDLVILSIAIASLAGPAAQEPLVVNDRAALILNPVKPDRTEEFEAGLAALRAALESTTHPVGKQQARGWKMYRAEEPHGPNVMYVFFLDPAVPFADYSFKKVLEDSLPAAEAAAALERLSGSLAGAQTVLSMKSQPPRAEGKSKF